MIRPNRDPLRSPAIRPPDRFGWLPQLLHWSLALVVMIQLGVSAATLMGGSVLPQLRGLHQGLGLVLWLLAMLLVLWRIYGRSPRPEATRFTWQIATSRIVSTALYALLLVLPPLGYLAASMTASRVRLPGTLSMPSMPLPPNAELALWIAATHRLLAWSFLACVVIHLGIALYHHLVVRDRMLERMLPPWSRA